jgi:hypothetical protein
VGTKTGIVVGQQAAITVNSSTAAASACLDDGAIKLTATGGKSPYTYSLNGATYVTGNTFTGLAAGTYTGYVKDAKGCVGTKTGIVVGQQAAMVVSYTKTNSTKCPPNGTITLTKTGGTSPYMYSINGTTYSTGNKFNGVPPGTYTGYVKDAKGCVATSGTITITGPVCSALTAMTTDTKPAMTAGNRSVKLSPNPASNFVKVQLFGYTGNVEVHLRSLDGKLLKVQKIQAASVKGAETSFMIADLSGGIYLVTVIDDKGTMHTEKLVVAH